MGTGFVINPSAPTSQGTPGAIISSSNLVSDACITGIDVSGVGKTELTVSGATLINHERSLHIRNSGGGMVTVSGSKLRTNALSAISMLPTVAGNMSLIVTGSKIERSSTIHSSHGVEVNNARHVIFTGNTVIANGYGVYFHNSPVRGVVTSNIIEITLAGTPAIASPVALPNVILAPNATLP
jgi:hypothetical protein